MSVQHNGHTRRVSERGNMDVLKRNTREIKQISTTKNSSLHHPVQEKVQGKRGREREREQKTLMRSPKKKTNIVRKTRENKLPQKMKQKKGQRQTQIVTKTVKLPSRKISTKKSTKWKLKKKIRLNT